MIVIKEYGVKTFDKKIWTGVKATSKARLNVNEVLTQIYTNHWLKCSKGGTFMPGSKETFGMSI